VVKFHWAKGIFAETPHCHRPEPGSAAKALMTPRLWLRAMAIMPPIRKQFLAGLPVRLPGDGALDR
jgi:hypothetical protein